MNATGFASSVLWQTIGWTMLQFLWIGGLAALVAGLVGQACRRRSPELRYALALGQFVLLALIPWGLFAWKLSHREAAAELAVAGRPPLANVLVPSPEIVSRQPGARDQLAIEADAAVDLVASETPGSVTEEARAERVAEPPSLPEQAAATPPLTTPASGALPRLTSFAPAAAQWLSSVLPWVWIVGFPLTCLWLLSGIAGAERFRRQCRMLDDDRAIAICRRLQGLLRLSRDVAIGVSDRIAAPILVGIVRPLILLPAATLAGGTVEQLEMILLHELAHVRRWDNLVNLLQRMVEAVLFFHPAIWWLSNRVRLEREHCCDAVVLAHIGKAEPYAEMLVQMALSRPRPTWALGTSIARDLIPRIQRILKHEDERMQVSRGLVAVAAGLMLSLAVVTVATAQREPAKAAAPPQAAEAGRDRADGKIAPPDQKSEVPVTQKPLTAEERAKFISIQGKVLEADGQPARWSSVWLLGTKDLPGGRYGATHLEAGRADQEGRFAFRHPRWREHNPRDDEPSFLWVLGRNRDGTLTAATELNLTTEYRGQTEIHGLELKALTRADYSGRIVDQKGDPISNAKVTPELLVLETPKGAPSSVMAWPRELAAEYAATSDASGHFVVRGLPLLKNIVAQISAPMFGSREMYWQTQAAPILRLDPPGTVRGRLSNLPGADFCEKNDLAIYMVPLGRLDSPEPGVMFQTRFSPQADGSFEIGDLPPGQYQVQVVPKAGSPTLPREFYTPMDCAVKSGQNTDNIELTLPKVIKVRGRVIDQQSGAGVAKAGVLFLEEQTNTRQFRATTTTNAEGEYVGYVTAGKIAVEHGSAPEGYLGPVDDIQTPAVMHTEDFEGPTLKLERAIKVHGTVVDEAGQPVVGAEVRWIQPFRAGQSHVTDVISAASGRFIIPQIDPQDSLPLRVRSALAVAAVVLQPDDLARPQTVVVSPQNAFRLKGTLTDDRGRPVPDASVAVHWHRTYVSKRTRMAGVGGQFEKHSTDRQGRFESGPLWSGDGYHVVIEAAGFPKIDLPNVKGTAGQVHDYGTLKLTGTSHSIAGRVVDPSGKPIADARVFNSGDAPQIVTTVTDKDGRFRLDGLIAGPVYVFADHTQYRFGGTYARNPAEEVLLTLIPLSAAPPQRPAFDFEALEAVRRQTVEQLQESAKAAGFTLRPNLRDSRFAALAKKDPDEALKQIGQQSPAMDHRSALLLAAQLTPRGPRKAGQEAADQKSAEIALKFVERQVSRIGDLDASRRLYATANAGLGFVRLGDVTRGKPLLEAAEKEWAGDPQATTGPNSYMIATIAKGLAWIDLPRALSYLDKITDESLKSHLRGSVIAEVSRFDMPRALALLKDPKYAPQRSRSDDYLKLSLAHRIGAIDPQQAVELVKSIQGDRSKAEACGWTAVAIAEKDPKLAWSLIDEGLTLVKNGRQSDPRSFYYEWLPGLGAHLAVQAAQIGHPEIDSIIQQVLALRIPIDSQTTTVSRLQATVNMALFLSFLDPVIARRLLADLEPEVNAGLLGNGGYQNVSRREWYDAWALADPAHAAEIFQAEMQKAKPAADSKEPVRAPDWIQEAVSLMALPAAERLDYLLEFHVANLSKPQYED